MAKTQNNLANVFIPNTRELTPEYIQYLKTVRDADYGKERRERLLALLDLGLEFAVNKTRCPQMSTDKDLQKLLKEGKIELFNVRMYKNHKTTHVRKKR